MNKYEHLHEQLKVIRKKIEVEYTGRNDLTIARRYLHRIERIYREGLPEYSEPCITKMARESLDWYMKQ